MEYKLGQRWVSHADAQLGLGIVSGLEARRVTLSFPAIGEERTYATDNAPLTRLRFKEGDHITTLEQLELQVTRVLEQDDLLTYEGLDHHEQEHVVSELELDAFVQLTTPQQRLLNGHFDKNADFALRVATLQHQHRLQQSPTRGLLGSRTSLLPHQVYIASEVGQRHAPRVLLADEVGLGKTIEAGMILHQQLLTGRAERALIIVPDSLLHQWLVEMLRRFNLHFALFDEERIEALIDGNPFETEQLVLCSLDLFNARQDLQEQALAAQWDLVVIDEAHHLHWSPDAPGEDYRFVEQLAASCAGLLLLTATPEQIGQESHFARLRLLDPSRFHGLESFLEEEKHYGELNLKLQELERDGADEEQVADLLDRHGTGRVLFRNSRAGISGFPERRLHAYPLDAGDYGQHGEGIEEKLYPELAHAEQEWLEFDPRVSWLEQQLKQLRPEKVLVICANASTALALEHHLHLRAGIRSAAFYEGLSILERDRAAAYFADAESGAQTLVCSEIGSEGRNFQFAQHLVLFDLPRNPDLLEQRIGRLDRIGQERDVHIHVPYLQATAQDTLFHWYDEGLKLFQESCSAGHAIYTRFQEQLESQLLSADDSLRQLIDETAEFTAVTRNELREGRDRLLERNSCNPELSGALISDIQLSEQSDELESYLDMLCQSYGVDQEYHSEQAQILRPGEQMLNGHFPGLREEGTTLTFERTRALSREDMEFLSWEHPMIFDAMDMVLSSELGNAAIATLSLRGIPAGTLLLECIFSINCVAPKNLQLGRFLPLTPIRLLVDARGKDLSEIVAHDRLNELCEKVRKSAAVAIIKQVHREVEEKMKSAFQQAERSMQEHLDRAENRMREQLGAELSRLEQLRQVNTSIRQEEIDHLRYLIEESTVHIRHATLQLQALRLIITT